MIWRRHKPAARRLWLDAVEHDALDRGGLLARPDGTIEAVIRFPSGGPAYAVTLDRRLARRLERMQQQVLAAAAPLIAEDA